jgi:hypothetical protein
LVDSSDSWPRLGDDPDVDVVVDAVLAVGVAELVRGEADYSEAATRDYFSSWNEGTQAVRTNSPGGQGWNGACFLG